jgi:hypothetical protein
MYFGLVATLVSMTATKSVKSILQMTDAEFRHDDAIVKKGAEEFAKVEDALVVVKRGIENYIEVGEALQRIRSKVRSRADWKRLTPDCDSFKSYVKKRLGTDRVRGYQLIDAAKTARLCQKEFKYTPPYAAIADVLTKMIKVLPKATIQEIIQDELVRHKPTVNKLKSAMNNAIEVHNERRRQENVDGALKNPKPELKGAAGAITVEKKEFDEFMAQLPEHSVDLIFTDPVWELFDDHAELLGQHAKRVLKPDGLLAVMPGTVYMPDWLERLRKHITYRWTLAYVFDGLKTSMRDLRIGGVNWEPVLLFGSSKRALSKDIVNMTKAANIGNPRLKTQDNPILESLEDEGEFFKPQKDFHKWGKNIWGLETLIGMMTKAGDTVLDPFCGGGSTLVAALLGETGPRRVWGCDKEQQWADLTRLECRWVYEGLCIQASMEGEDTERSKNTWRLFGEEAIQATTNQAGK